MEFSNPILAPLILHVITFPRAYPQTTSSLSVPKDILSTQDSFM